MALEQNPTEAPEGMTPETGAIQDPPKKDPNPDGESEAPSKKKIEQYLRTQVKQSERWTDDNKQEWANNVEVRMGESPDTYTAGINVDSSIQSELNPDWSLSKRKVANLYSQLPKVIGTHQNKQFTPVIGAFTKELNFQIGEKRSDVGSAMTETSYDIVNASGFGAVVVSYDARFDTVKMPKEQRFVADWTKLPPAERKFVEEHQLIELIDQPRRVSWKIDATRISPADLLRPPNFRNSNFDKAPWIGYRDTMSRAEAKTSLKLSDDQLEQATSGGDPKKPNNSLRIDDESQTVPAEYKPIRVKNIFYRRYLVDPTEMNYDAIWKVVFVEGLDKEEAPIHEAWKGQKIVDETGAVIGSRNYPVRVAKTTYVSDNPLPMSETSAGRPQVIDLRRSRSQIFMQRERSLPIRGFDTIRVDPDVRDALQRGEFQGLIPFMGPAKDAIWEVSRASYPAENLALDQQTMQDLEDVWMDKPSMPIGGAGTKSEVQAATAAFATVNSVERAEISKFFLGIVECIAGLMTLYSDFPSLMDQEKQALRQGWDMQKVPLDIALSILPDAMILMDPAQRINRDSNLLNLTVKSGMVNPLPILGDLVENHGYDPAEILKQPDPPKPREPQVSLRLNGKEDMTNPVVLGILHQLGKGPTDESVEKGKQTLVKAQMPPAPPQRQLGPGQPPGPGPMNQAHPQWSLASKIAKRSRDMASSAAPGSQG